MNTSSPILTPDQRLRVFISSTLQELAEERQAVKKAIEQIHLTPVLFELGARPHAPRNLYREYLAQSHIFIGIYWDRYGWVAPEETISGLEDEYNLSGHLPKLIYIKKTAGAREERLAKLLKRIQQDDKASYKSFSTPEELGELIINDLAILLTERFSMTLQQPRADETLRSIQPLPAIPNALIGREKDVQDITALLSGRDHRLVTLVGPGGIGKTRLAIEVARRLEDEFNDGVAYIALAPVRDYRLVPETISYSLGVKVGGSGTMDSLKLFLQDKHFLLVLDNFEQVMEAAPVIDELLLAAPQLKIIVTSRERLAVTFEHLYRVPTLSMIDCDKVDNLEEISPAVRLFVERAKAVQPSFRLNEKNRADVCAICERLEGLPLAIELAAGQINLLTPAKLLQRLDHSLDVLKGGFRDIPDRQKTMRNAIAWSYDLLTPAEQKLLLQISLYRGGCLLKAIETMDTGDTNEDNYTALNALVNKSLLTQHDEDSEFRFHMYESVREFAMEKMREQQLVEIYGKKQAEFYHQEMQVQKLHHIRQDQPAYLRYMEKEHTNIRQVLDFLMQHKDLKRITEMAWNLWLFWWVNAHTREGYEWLKRTWELYHDLDEKFDDHTFSILASNVGAMSFLQRDFEMFNETMVKHLDLILQQDDDELIATATLITGVVKTIMKQYDEAERLLETSLEHFTRIGLSTGMSLALSGLGRNAVYHGDQGEKARAYYKRSLDLARRDKNEISVIICLSGFALCEVMDHRPEALQYLKEGLTLSKSLHFYEAIAWSMELWALASINEQQYEHAVTLLGATEHLRNVARLPVWDDLQDVIVHARKGVEAVMDPAIFRNAWNKGMAMNLDQMVTFTMAG